jgi:hypothetical protein
MARDVEMSQMEYNQDMEDQYEQGVKKGLAIARQIYLRETSDKQYNRDIVTGAIDEARRNKDW